MRERCLERGSGVRDQKTEEARSEAARRGSATGWSSSGASVCAFDIGLERRRKCPLSLPVDLTCMLIIKQDRRERIAHRWKVRREMCRNRDLFKKKQKQQKMKDALCQACVQPLTLPNCGTLCTPPSTCTRKARTLLFCLPAHLQHP